jgi:hypothetical protein
MSISKRAQAGIIRCERYAGSSTSRGGAVAVEASSLLISTEN